MPQQTRYLPSLISAALCVVFLESILFYLSNLALFVVIWYLPCLLQYKRLVVRVSGFLIFVFICRVWDRALYTEAPSKLLVDLNSSLNFTVSSLRTVTLSTQCLSTQVRALCITGTQDILV